jgi:hypothetical protein
MIPKSGNRFSEKIMRKRNPIDQFTNRTLPTSRKSRCDCPGLTAQKNAFSARERR